MPAKRSLLFYGELPPVAVHGIAISNMLNLKILQDYYNIEIIEEKTTLNKQDLTVPSLLAKRLIDHYRILRKTFRRKIDFFYLTFSISDIGALKTLLSILCFRLFNNGKVILHIHRGDFVVWYNKGFFSRMIAGRVMKLASRVIVLSETQKEVFTGIFSRPVHVLHNTVECEYDYALAKREENRFIYISNYLPEKGIIDLLEVFNRLLVSYPAMTLYTYGAFPSEEMKNRVLKYRNPKICIGEIITGKEKFTEIARADCLILPSLNEGEPVVLLEAMSVGTPVIATGVGSIPEMLGKDYPFSFLPGNQAGLEEKIIQFMNCKDKIGISNRLKERYLLHYSNMKHKSDLVSIFT